MDVWFTKALTRWYHQNKRDLPWRHESDPYKIWLSEVILQQTQVVQGLAYYQKFVKTFPTVKSLAQAPEDEVLRLWQGLGYYSRARNLHAASKAIVKEHQGKFPKNYESIRALKGVGDYTAAAIASFAYGQAYAVLDGNVYRVLSRIFGVTTPIDSNTGKKEFQKLADQLLDKKNPADHNQAIMEFGSQYCKPVSPNCQDCIFKSRCYASQKDMVAGLPVKEKKVKVRHRYFNYLVVIDKSNRLLIRKRGDKDIWAGLYEFPLIEAAQLENGAELLRSPSFKAISKARGKLIYESKPYKHILSHQHLHAKFCVVRLSVNFRHEIGNYINYDDLNGFGVPRLIGKFLSDCSLKEML